MYSTQYLILHSTVLFFGCFFACVYLVPKIKIIVHAKQLMENSNHRSSHMNSTPSFGGIAFFMVFIFALYFNDTFDKYHFALSILPGVTLMFFLGLKDDLIPLSARVKFTGQIIACLFVIFHFSFQLENFHGFFGIFEIPWFVRKLIVLFLMISIINAYNLVDGIDGLAALLSIVAFICFSMCFFFIGNYFLALTSVSMVGALMGFINFNLSRSNKIFMGDTGSLVIGFIIAVMSIQLLAIKIELSKLPFDPKYVPALMGTITFIPLFDVLRVFTLRISKRKSPLTADRNHIHHVIMDKYGWSHRRTAFAITVLSIVIINFSFALIILGYGLKLLVLFIVSALVILAAVLQKWSNDIELRRKEQELVIFPDVTNIIH